MAQAGATLNRRGPKPAKTPRKPFRAYIEARRFIMLREGISLAGLSENDRIGLKEKIT